ncbi:MAG: hypothetical protein SFX73_23895 [Kofleriaceae bacterium]|nr:hypothetical protein [Kofleriaceae bacterium]
MRRSSLFVAVVAVVVLGAITPPAAAQPGASVQPGAVVDCAPEADRLHAHLVEAERSTYRWNLSWTLAFGAASAGQAALALTETNPLGEYNEKYRDTLLVGSAKAGIGFLSRIVLPLRVSVPAPTADRCADLTALRTTVTKLATKEKRMFWLTHLGGAALNLAGAGLLWHRHSFTTGAVSFAISLPVGWASAYTLPRKSWKLVRAEAAQWNVTATATGEQTTLSLQGTW